MEEKIVGESSKQALAQFVSQCAVITLKNSEECMLMNNKWSQQWLVHEQDNCSLRRVKALERSDFEMPIKEKRMQIIHAGEINASNQNISPTKRTSKWPKPI